MAVAASSSLVSEWLPEKPCVLDEEEQKGGDTSLGHFAQLVLAKSGSFF